MSTPNPDFNRSRFLTFADIAGGLRRIMDAGRMPLALILAALCGLLLYQGSENILGYILIAVGTWASLALWGRMGIGLPVLPMFVLQHFFTFALPILTDNETLERYPAGLINLASFEVFILMGVMSLTWYFALQQMRSSPPVCYALQGFEKDGLKRLRFIGSAMIIGITAFNVARMTGFMNTIYAVLPSGMNAIVNALTSAVGVCGFFLVAMLQGSGEEPPWQRTVLWTLFAINLLVLSSGFILSSASLLVGAVFIGLLWGSGRVPWRFIIILVSILAFLNFGKFVMRERYWVDEDEMRNLTISLVQLPEVYAEWAEASYDLLVNDAPPEPAVFSRAPSREGQSLLNRVNNMQNLLYVMDSIENYRTPVLHGATYTLIPPLLVPRYFWPDKPRAHEGQIMLNIHFGRQSLEATAVTFVAWGLLAEACGNFGLFYGSIFLGIVLGLFCAWTERFTTAKLLFSLEGLLALVIFMGLLNSYEMVASVLITSIFQSLFPVLMGCSPFVERQSSLRPDVYGA